MSIKVGDTVQIKKNTVYADWVGINGEVEAVGEEIAFVNFGDAGLKVPLELLIKVEEPQEPKSADEITITRARFREVAFEAVGQLVKAGFDDNEMASVVMGMTATLAFAKCEKILFGELSENA